MKRVQMATEFERIVQNVLQRFDVDGNTEISWNEFYNALANEGVDADTITEMRAQVFANWDSDKNQRLSLQEVHTLALKWASYPGDQSHQ